MCLLECFPAIFPLIGIWMTRVLFFCKNGVVVLLYIVYMPDRLIGRTTGFGPVNLGSSPSPAAH